MISSKFIEFQAMNLLYDLRDSSVSSLNNLRLSPLKAWLHRHGRPSLNRFEHLCESGLGHPLTFQAETPMKKFVAYIDPDNNFNIADKLSQVINRSL